MTRDDIIRMARKAALFIRYCGSSRQAEQAAEMRRLHEHNQELLKALKTITLMCESVGDFSNGVTDYTGTIDEGAILAIGVIQDARAAISKAEGQA